MAETSAGSLHALLWIAIVLLVVEAGVIAVLWRARRRGQLAEAQNRAILDAVLADLAILNRDGQIEICNASWRRSRDSGNPFTSGRPGQPWLAATAPRLEAATVELPRVQEAVEAVLSGDASDRELEYAWQLGPERRWSHLRVRSLDRAAGGAVIAHVDVTAWKRIESETRGALHELAHMNMRAGMGELVSTVAHELTQSLTASLGNAQVLKRMITDARTSSADLSAVIDDISDANRQASEIIRRVRTMMRKEPFDLQPLDVNALVLEVVQVLNSSAANDGVLLVADLDPDLPAVPGDRVQIRQVTMNLIVNAIQASREHSGSQTVVVVATNCASDDIVVTVDDQGPGLDDQAMGKIFEPYFTTKDEGLGVGLSISRTIVESHGGVIQAANRPNGGARFSVSLPRN